MNTSPVLIDTNVLSELAKPSPDEAVVAWFRKIDKPITSSIVIYEIAHGIERLSRGKRRIFLEEWFAQLLDNMDVVPIDHAVALSAARLEVAANREGRSIELRDLFIASTAAAQGALLVTRNLNHFKGLGVRLYDPFKDQMTT